MTLTTPHLTLRPPRLEDAASVAALMTPEVSRWLAAWPPRMDEAEAARRILDAQAEIAAGRALHWLVESRDTAQVAGWVRITRDERDPARGEVGFWIGAAYHGRGWATEAVGAALRAGFHALSLAVIEGGAQPANEASQRVMRRVGMVQSGVRDVWAPARQRHEPCVFYALRNDQRGAVD